MADDCSTVVVLAVIAIVSLIVMGMGAAVIDSNLDMKRHLVAMDCNVREAVVESSQRGGVCHEADIYDVSCVLPGSNATSIRVHVVFPQLRVTPRGSLVCNKKDELTFPPTNAQMIRVWCDTNHFFFADEVRCHYASYSPIGWIVGLTLGVLLWTCILGLACFAFGITCINKCSHLCCGTNRTSETQTMDVHV